VLVQYTVSKTTAVPGGIGVMNPWYRTVRAAAPGEVGTAKCGSSLPEAERTSFGVQPCRGWYTASDGTNVEKIRKDIDRDKILTAAEAKEYGLVDNILASRKKSGLVGATTS
jgi:hypothetical protein